jgi:GntR family transcriptional regulator
MLSERLAGQRGLRADHQPLYVRAEGAIRDVVRQLDLHPGARLPGETKLAEMLGVSRPTVREALRRLELNKEIRRVHGLGTLVGEPQAEIVAGLETLESLETIAEREAWACGTKEVTVAELALTRSDAEALNRQPGGPGVQWLRTKTRDERPFSVMESVLPGTLQSVTEVVPDFAGSIIDSFRRSSRQRVHLARAGVSLDVASDDVASRLGIAVGSFLLLMTEIFYGPESVPLCLNRNWFISGSVRLEFVRRPPS